MKLESLEEVFNEVHSACRSVPALGVFLSQNFKDEFLLHIKSSHPCGYTSVDFGVEVACFSNRKGQVSYVPASGFVLAHKLVRYYRTLEDYKSVLKEVSKEEIKKARNSQICSEKIERAIKTANLDNESASFVRKFISDYSWWGGGKGIERGDFHVSPLMTCAGLQAESQSAIADLTEIFASNQNLYRIFSFDENVVDGKSILKKALEIFKRYRRGDAWMAGEYCKVNTSVRNYYSDLSEERIRSFDESSFQEFCKEHTWAGAIGSGWAQLSKSDYRECTTFFSNLCSEYCLPYDRWSPNAQRPFGVGSSLVSELLMKLHPNNFGLYNRRTHEALKFLGFAEGEFSPVFSMSDYVFAQGRLEEIRREMAKMKIGKTIDENTGNTDFIAVNEFLWFVDNNKTLIKEEMVTQMKSTEHRPFDGEKEFDFSDDSMLLRLVSALRTKPFAILAGHSGTGKSRMVRKLAYMTCCDEGLRMNGSPGNFCMVQVKPNWHDSTELLGYYSSLAQRYETTEFVQFICKAYAYPDVPFFVCMDEMNLAPVEQYFAEYLSAIESTRNGDGVVLTDALVPREVYGTATELGVESTESAKWISEYGLTIPKNLFVVGTVNMDETTCQFSRKVLDRAMTIEMNEINFDTFGQKGAEPSFSDTLKLTEAKKLLTGKCRAESLTDGQKSLLNRLKNVLLGTPFAVAYRFANEYALYTDSLNTFGSGDENIAFDHMILMKVLPRIIGEKEIVKDIFEGRGGGGLKSLLGENSLSRRKMDEILGRNESYLSFWP